MGDQSFQHLNAANRDLLVQREAFLNARIKDAASIIHLLRRCRVRVLMVVDGLDYSLDDFGLHTFVTTLLDAPGSARFEITLAHIFSETDAGMMASEPRIAARIENFKFDNAAHFAVDKYDVVFLFGIATSFAGRGAGYPADGLSNAELQALAAFQNGGGGLFATGDHGALGRPLGHKVARARNMRLWASTSGVEDDDEVSMGGERRNDTNRLGDAGSQFADQSDAVPQPISPTMYTVTTGIFRYSFPHPLLCGPNGVIRVMPDHPHEGECITPPDPNLNLNFTGPAGAEYPPATGAGPRPLPEIVATSTVLSGTRSGSKDPTIAHSFAGICAYDGHRAGVGRVVTDATWHHFVNINLIGDNGFPVGTEKGSGFLWSAAGQAHLQEIKTYFRNIATWLARPANLSCMRSRLLWDIVFEHRVLEAVLTTRGVALKDIRLKTLYLIGQHARDAIGRYAGQCQSRRLILDIFPIEWLERFPGIDPWWNPLRDKLRDDGVPWVDMNPVLEIALGAALVALNEKFGLPNPELAKRATDKAILAAASEGARTGLELAMQSLTRTAAGVAGPPPAKPRRPKSRD